MNNIRDALLSFPFTRLEKNNAAEQKQNTCFEKLAAVAAQKKWSEVKLYITKMQLVRFLV